MGQSNNAAAEQIIRAQSIIRDLTTQMSELQSAVNSQTELVAMLTPLAVWADPVPDPSVEPETPEEPEEPNDNELG